MPRRRLAAPRARGAPAIAALAVLLGIAAPAAAQAPAAQAPTARPTAAPGDPAAPAAPAGAPAAPSGATPAPSPSAPPPSPSAPAPSPSPPEAPPAPPGSAPMPAPQGYYLMPLSLPPWANPRTIEYEEGDPIPRGYALKTRADRSLVTAGLVAFGVSFGVSFAAAGTATLAEEDFDDVGPLLIPFVGPMIAATTLDAEGASLFILTLDAVTQVGGLLLIAAGLAHEEVYLERQFPVRSHGAEENAASRWPTLSIGASSAELRWRF